MASTRNKNTSGNYCLEQRQYTEAETYNLYKNSASGVAYSTKLAGNGLIQGAIPRYKLSYNAADIESFLFGINANNLVTQNKCFTPELTPLSSEDLFQKSATYIPDPLVIEKDQRPGYLS